MCSGQRTVYFSNLNAKRDKDFTPEGGEIMGWMPERDKADNYVVGMGERDSAKKFLERLFRDDGIEFEFKNEG